MFNIFECNNTSLVYRLYSCYIDDNTIFTSFQLYYGRLYCIQYSNVILIINHYNIVPVQTAKSCNAKISRVPIFY